MSDIPGEIVNSGYIVVDPSGLFYTGDTPKWSPVPTNALIITSMDWVHDIVRKGDRIFPATLTLSIGPETDDFYDSKETRNGQ